MIVDTSAVVAVFLREPEFERIVDAFEGAESLAMGTPTLAETGIVLSRRLRADAASRLAYFLGQYAVESLSFGPQHWQVAVDAYTTFGKGRHPAALNFGDCLAYATAKVANQPLLFVGQDFSRTDIVPALG